MKFKLKNSITLYEVYQDLDVTEMVIYRVKPVNLSTLDGILDLGRTTSYDEISGYTNLFDTEAEAIVDAYKKTALSNIFTDFNSCTCSECTECNLPEPTIEELYPMSEYPSKLVKFDTTDTIRLFKRRPGQKPAFNCAFITQKEADKFKKDADIKSNYSLTKLGRPSLYSKYVDKYFD